MNTKSIILTLMLCALLIGLAGIRLSSHASSTDNNANNQSSADETVDETVELTWSFEIRIRLPILKKDAI